MNFSRSFTYVFDDPEWLMKLALGAIIGMVPILNLAWLGYAIEITRRVQRGEARPLADWDDFPKYFLQGLYMGCAAFLWMLPWTILMCLGLFTILLPVILTGSSDLADTITPFSTVGSLVLMGMSALYGLAFSFIYPAIVLNLSEKGTIGSTLHIGEVIAIIRTHTSSYLSAWLIGLGATLLAGIIGGMLAAVVAWIPFIGWIAGIMVGPITSAWSTMVIYNAYGLVRPATASNAPSPLITT